MNNRERLREVANGRPTPRDLTPEQVEHEDFERVRSTLYMALVAEAIPRRLGARADPAALALDKRVARKVANTYRTLWAAVDAADVPRWANRGERLMLAKEAELGARKAGATVDWAKWLRSRLEELAERRADVAAFALDLGRPRWGVRRLRLLDNELDNLRRIAAEAVVVERRRHGRSRGA